jgi:predicted 3-demethylubiquinone-9 3-methyltransferase (glyoxalase superfamily)
MRSGDAREIAMAESVHTHLMFQNGRALDAMHRYEEIFEGAFTIDELDTYDESATGLTGQVQLAVCTLPGARITCIDSPVQHAFDMTPAISLIVECDDDDELERLFAALEDDGQVFMPLDNYGFSRRSGWVQDRFGVPWQLNLW